MNALVRWMLREAEAHGAAPVPISRIDAYVLGCKREGAPGLGDWLVAENKPGNRVNFCAAGRGFAEAAVFSDSQQLMPWRAGALELRNDYVAAGRFHSAADVRAGKYLPKPGDAVFYWRVSPTDGSGHIETVWIADTAGYCSIGANERGGRWHVDNSPISYDHPRLLGFGEWVRPTDVKAAKQEAESGTLLANGCYTDSPQEVAARYTPVPLARAVEVFSTAFLAVERGPLRRGQLCLMLAQSALETGQWKLMRNFNVGHLKASTRYPGKHAYYACDEVYPSGLRKFEPPAPQCRFRAYPSLLAGVTEYVKFLAIDTNGNGRNKYAKAWAALMAEQPEVFANELAAAGYFTANLETYRHGLVALFNQFMTDPTIHMLRVAPEAPTTMPPTDVDAKQQLHDPLYQRVQALLANVDVDWDEYIEARDEEMAAT
jgi:hypothetical protein